MVPTHLLYNLQYSTPERALPVPKASDSVDIVHIVLGWNVSAHTQTAPNRVRPGRASPVGDRHFLEWDTDCEQPVNGHVAFYWFTLISILRFCIDSALGTLTSRMPLT